MDNQKNNFNSDSNLDFLFKEALQNHGVPTEDHIWRRIQNGLADKNIVISQPIAKRSYLPIWSAITGIAASVLVWAVFFGNSNQNDLNNLDTNSVATISKTEIVKELNNIENNVVINSNTILENTESNKNKEATSSKVIASKKQQIPPTIIKNTTSKNKIKNIDIYGAVASLEKDQTKIKKSQEKVNDKTFATPSTHISENVWAGDFVVQSSDFSPSLKKDKNNVTTHQLNLDDQTVAITIKVGKNDNYSTTDFTTSQATGFDANSTPSQFDKAKNVLKEVWNLKTGKKVNLQNILPNNENEKATEKATTNQSNSNNEIQAD